MQLVNELEICRKYREDEESTVSLGEEYGISATQVRRILIKHSEHVRDKTEAQEIAIKKGRKIPPMQGKRHSGKTRKQISEKLTAMNQQKRKEEEVNDGQED